ncbi:MAG: sulfatase-like hydrolase/transferase [Myxococcota bacterium]|nr:sulfatase-like hydrolase/transferase [Myxococcota bacterium]
MTNLTESIFGFFLSGVVIGCMVGLIFGISSLPASEIAFYVAGSIGMHAVALGLVGLFIGLIHPSIPSHLGPMSLFRAVKASFVQSDADSLQGRSRIAATIWVVALVVLAGASFLARGYGLILGRIQSPEFASVGAAIFGLFVVASVLVVAAPLQASFGRSFEHLIRRRPNLTFLVNPILNMVLSTALIVFLLYSTVADEKTASLDLPWQAVTVFIVSFVFLYLLGEWLSTKSIRLPSAKRLQLAALFLFMAGFALVLGLRSPNARAALSKDVGLNQVMMALIRLPFDEDGDGYAAILSGGDCDDTDPDIHPGAVDIAGNQIDEDCDGILATSDAKKSRRNDTKTVRELGFSPPYSFVLVTVDGLRMDHLGFYGYGRETTPAIDDMASESVVFKNAYGVSSLMPASIASLMAGRFPSELHRDFKETTTYLDTNVFLAETLLRQGYHTAAFPSDSYFSNKTGFEQGFSHWQPYKISQGRQPFVPTAQRVVTSAFEHLGRLEPDPTKPYFLWLHIVDPQPNYLQHLGVTTFGASQVDRYDHELRYVDNWLEWFFKKLRQRQDWNDSIVLIIAGTRGEDFVDEKPARLDEATLRIPLIIRVPGVPPRPVESRVSLIDLAPTLLGLADIGRFNSGRVAMNLRGSTLVQSLLGKAAKSKPILAESPSTQNSGKQWAWLDGAMKLHYDGRASAWRVFDVSRDPDELVDLAPERPELRDKLRTSMQQYRSRLNLIPAQR